jgi:plastocyanin
MKRLILLLGAGAIGCVADPQEQPVPQLPLCGDPSPVSSVQLADPGASASVPPAELLPSDRVGYPQGYRENFRQFYVFDRFDARSVSFVCANETAASVRPGEPFPYGSILAFESWRPLTDGDDELVLDADGRLIRSALNGIILMRKEEGFGAGYGEARSGEWEYVAFRPDGTYLTAPEASTGCASCHAAGGTAERDFVFRTNVHFMPVMYARSDPVEEGQIGISRMGFQQRTRTVSVGTTVVWQNSTIDETPHAVTAGDGSFSSGVLAPGESFSHTFTAPGRYEYTCALHPQQMRGVIEVTAG